MTDHPRLPLFPDANPPAALAGRVVQSLRARGLIAQPHRTRSLRAIAATLLLGAGFALGWAAARTPSEPRGTRYVLLLYGEAIAPPGTPVDSLIAEYRRWAEDLRAEGRYEFGERLGEQIHVVGAPIVPASAAMSGLFILRADSPAEARALADGCPHVRYGGSVAVMRIAQVGAS